MASISLSELPGSPGGSPGSPGSPGSDPVHLLALNQQLRAAAKSGDVPTAAEVLRAGADPNWRDGPEYGDDTGSSLAHAAYIGNRPLCKMLLKFGALCTGVAGETVVEAAQAGGHVTLAEWLRSKLSSEARSSRREAHDSSHESRALHKAQISERKARHAAQQPEPRTCTPCMHARVRPHVYGICAHAPHACVHRYAAQQQERERRFRGERMAQQMQTVRDRAAARGCGHSPPRQPRARCTCTVHTAEIARRAVRARCRCSSTR